MKTIRKLVYARRHLESNSDWSSSQMTRIPTRSTPTFDANHFPRVSSKIALRIPGWNYYETFTHFMSFPTLATVAQASARTNRRPDHTAIFKHRAHNVQDDLVKLLNNHEAWRRYIKHTLKIGTKMTEDKPLINSRILCFDSLNLMTAVTIMIRHNNFYSCDAEAAALHARDALMHLYLTAASIAEGSQSDDAWNTLFKQLETIDDNTLRKAKPNRNSKNLVEFEHRMMAKSRGTNLHIHQLRNDRRLNPYGYPVYDTDRFHFNTICIKFPVVTYQPKASFVSPPSNNNTQRPRHNPSQLPNSHQKQQSLPQPAYQALISKRDSQGNGFCIKHWMGLPCHQSPCRMTHTCPICETSAHNRTTCSKLAIFLANHQ